MSTEAAQSEVPKVLQCWLSQEEKDKPLERQRWMSRPTFILAAIGSAIGLGNFWRFPFLTFKHGGGEFFVPWATCLFVMGIPFMIMELALGQKFQRGDIAVFRGIDKRLTGIGVISVYSSYVFSFYYNVVVAWALVYVIVAFRNPLPYSQHAEGVWPCPEDKMSRAEQFYRIYVIRLFSEEGCDRWQDGDGSGFSSYALGATFLTWVIIFFCVFKGVKSSSYIVWMTVPLPVFFVIVMIIKGSTLENAGEGINRYFAGNDKETTSVASRWSDAAGQIFLGLSVCLGIMTSYGSYNDPKKPIIMDSVIISVSNCGFSFVAGFAVWTVVGYLEGLGKLNDSNISGVGLAFITYPTAIDYMAWPNLWALLLGLTLFMLGIDSSFSAIEATSTVICDTAWAGKAPRMFIAFLLCVIGFIGSIPFCCNWGFILFDVVDHYMCNYLLLLIGILQAFGCGWFFDVDQCLNKIEGHKKSLLFLSFTYWGLLLFLSFLTVFLNEALIGMIVFWVLYAICLGVGFFLSKVSFNEYWWDILMCGVQRIAYSCSQMGRPEGQEKIIMWWENAFAVYWCVLVKFVNPMLLMFIMVAAFKGDIEKPYEDYSTVWRVIGFSIPFIGLVLFIVATLFCQKAQELDYTEFKLYTDADWNPAATDAQKTAKVNSEQELAAVAAPEVEVAVNNEAPAEE